MSTEDVRAAAPMLRVLESAEPPNERTNPYLPLLVRSLPPTVQPQWFSWRAALVGSFDVFHLHWPEVKLRGRSRTRTFARWAMFLVLLLRIRLGRKALVRTLHNAVPHDSLPLVPRWLMDVCDRWTTAWILLSEVLPPPTPAPAVVVPHGHYRDWFAERARSAPVPGRILHVGLVRRYKGIDSLLRAFAGTRSADLTLRVVGATIDEDVAAEVRTACANDPRITSLVDYVPEDELVREITSSELVVLPFAAITNSGSLLLALSLDRPVLVPSGPMTDALAAEVGPGWVLTYDGALQSATLEQALVEARSLDLDGHPDLSGREWGAIGATHAEVFAEAAARARSHPPRLTHP